MATRKRPSQAEEPSPPYVGFVEIMKSAQRKTPSPRGRDRKKPDPRELNRATTDEFEREGMGVAPKE
ncbi:MAG TPA: hypothetical protein VNS11_01095 [Sphingomicrobium sp.]|nr:hypothetical protein [Sphingomicrobium sp.]